MTVPNFLNLFLVLFLFCSDSRDVTKMAQGYSVKRVQMLLTYQMQRQLTEVVDRERKKTNGEKLEGNIPQWVWYFRKHISPDKLSLLSYEAEE